MNGFPCIMQLSHIERNGPDPELRKLVSEICDGLPSLFHGVRVRPSILHGDLWSGNWAFADGQPVIYDPAVYCGHAEAELSILTLFGSPSAAFFDAYLATMGGPDPGHEDRRNLYQLYHLMNHYAIFGGAFRSQSIAAARNVLRAIR